MRLLPLVLVLAACPEPTTGTARNLVTLFPFDGAERDWTFTSEAEPDVRLIATRSETSETVDVANGTAEVWTLAFETACQGAVDGCVDGPERTLRLSADARNGVLVHGLYLGANDADFVTPVQIADATAVVGDVWTTDLGDVVVTSTYVGGDACDVPWSDNLTDCTRLELSGPGTGLDGTLWVTASWGIVAFQLEPDADRWELAFASWVEE